MHKNLIVPTIKSFTKCIAHTLNPDYIRDIQNFSRRYASIQAHPDDELLIAGLVQRILKYTENPVFFTLTDGNRNTNIDRVSELQKSFRYLGAKTSIECLLSEKEILDLLTTEQGKPEEVSPSNIKKAAYILGKKIDYLEEKIAEANSNTLLTDDYGGGHFIHDLTQMITVLTARRLRQKDRSIEVYEFPQYWIKLETKQNISGEQVKEFLRGSSNPRLTGKELKKITHQLGLDSDEKVQLHNFAKYIVGKFVSGDGRGLTDPRIGMYKGAIHLTLKEMIKKSNLPKFHKSQKSSFDRMFNYASVFGDLSVEKLRKVDLNRDYTKRPNSRLLLYECVPWRPDMVFKTFSNLYQEMMARE